MDGFTGRRTTSPADLHVDHLVSGTLTAVDHKSAGQDLTGMPLTSGPEVDGVLG